MKALSFSNVRFEVLTTVKMMMIFWDVTPCGLVDRYQCFSETLVSTYKSTQHHNPEE
jgi:hypothetical protein